ncbi:MAG: cyclic nucleotide-binding domain-containing protein, partial [Acidobacteria bacterium]|nr:cyclic nucleotide-binding domain-containing protein [Acidobacteriota bacterium]
MPRTRKNPIASPKTLPFDVQAFLQASGIRKKVVEYRAQSVIYSQGDPSDSVMYIQKGAVRLSVLSHAGKEAIVGMLGPGDFLGEGARAAQSIRHRRRHRGSRDGRPCRADQTDDSTA